MATFNILNGEDRMVATALVLDKDESHYPKDNLVDLSWFDSLDSIKFVLIWNNTAARCDTMVPVWADGVLDTANDCTEIMNSTFKAESWSYLYFPSLDRIIFQ